MAIYSYPSQRRQRVVSFDSLKSSPDGGSVATTASSMTRLTVTTDLWPRELVVHDLFFVS